MTLVVIDTKQRDYNFGTLHFDTRYDTNYGKLEPSAAFYSLLIGIERHIVFSKRVIGRDGEIRPHNVWLPWGLVLAELPDQTYHRVGYFEFLYQLEKCFHGKAPRTTIFV
jgi:hypothetical protein